MPTCLNGFIRQLTLRFGSGALFVSSGQLAVSCIVDKKFWSGRKKCPIRGSRNVFFTDAFTAAKLTGCSGWKCKLMTRSFVKFDLRCRMTGYFISYSRSNFVRFEFDLMIPNSSKYGLKWATLVSSPLAIVFSELTRVWFCVRRNRVEICLIRNRFPFFGLQKFLFRRNSVFLFSW